MLVINLIWNVCHIMHGWQIPRHMDSDNNFLIYWRKTMNSLRNRLFVALGSVAAIGLLLAAFMVVWLVPRGPETGDAKEQAGGNTQTSGSSTKSANAPSNFQAGASSMAPISDQAHIAVHGTGSISAKPDLVNLQVGVQVQKDKLEDAQSEASSKMDAVMKQLKGASVDDKDISTSQYNVEPVMNYNPNQAPTVTGFRVTNILNVKLRDSAKAGKLIDDLVSSGANTLYGVSFSFSDPSALMRQAREQAMTDARSKADQLATLGGVTLGAPILIEDGGSNTPPQPMMLGASDMQKSMAGAPATPINPGQQEIRVDVSVQYAIK